MYCGVTGSGKDSARLKQIQYFVSTEMKLRAL